MTSTIACGPKMTTLTIVSIAFMSTFIIETKPCSAFLSPGLIVPTTATGLPSTYSFPTALVSSRQEEGPVPDDSSPSANQTKFTPLPWPVEERKSRNSTLERKYFPPAGGTKPSYQVAEGTIFKQANKNKPSFFPPPIRHTSKVVAAATCLWSLATGELGRSGWLGIGWLTVRRGLLWRGGLNLFTKTKRLSATFSNETAWSDPQQRTFMAVEAFSVGAVMGAIGLQVQNVARYAFRHEVMPPWKVLLVRLGLILIVTHGVTSSLLHFMVRQHRAHEEDMAWKRDIESKLNQGKTLLSSEWDAVKELLKKNGLNDVEVSAWSEQARFFFATVLALLRHSHASEGLVDSPSSSFEVEGRVVVLGFGVIDLDAWTLEV